VLSIDLVDELKEIIDEMNVQQIEDNYYYSYLSVCLSIDRSIDGNHC